MLSPFLTSRLMSRSTQNGLKYAFHQPNRTCFNQSLRCA